MMWTDDPVRDAARYDAELERWEARFPVCQICGEHIVDGEEYVEMGANELYHWECFEEANKRTMRDDFSGRY